MKNEQIEIVWELYQNNCAVLEKSVQKLLRELDDYVSHLEYLTDDGERAKDERDRLRLEVEDLDEECEDHIRRIDDLEEENGNLRAFVAQLMAYIDPTEHQDACNRECPAYSKCAGSTFCEFPNWANERMHDLRIEVD